ncbi:MAG: hypothetical protein K9K78_00985 [Spirochaetales bacterium]|nr:hypothetical protein [Spirochaetales bacterium]
MSVEDNVFDESYEMTLLRLKDISESPDFSLKVFEKELDTLQKFEGLDWTGRGEIKNAEIRGQILAYQAFIYRWKNGKPIIPKKN